MTDTNSVEMLAELRAAVEAATDAELADAVRSVIVRSDAARNIDHVGPALLGALGAIATIRQDS